MCQSVSKIPSVKVFFNNGGFSSFTSLSPKRTELFTSLGIEIPRPGETRWYYRSRTIGVIFEKYEMLLTALEEIVKKPQSWDDATLTQARGLLQHLNSFLFCFLLCLFNKVLEQSFILYSILQNRSTDFSFGIVNIKNFVAFLTDLRSDVAFDDLLSSTIDMAGQSSFRSDKKTATNKFILKRLIWLIPFYFDTGGTMS